MGEEQVPNNNGANPDELSLDNNNNNNNNNNNRVLDWEIGLPNSDELIPLTQSLISPQLASAFSIKLDQQSPDPIAFPGSQLPVPLSEDKEQPDVSSFPATNSGGTSKRQRLVWTPKLHERFVEVVSRLGEKAVPKAIMQVMNVEGLTRENVASHLQKYRIYEKRMLGTPSDFVRVRENAIAVQEFQSPAAAFAAIPMPVFGFQQQQWFGNQAGMTGSHYAYGRSVERIEGWSGDSNRVPYDRRI